MDEINETGTEDLDVSSVSGASYATAEDEDDEEMMPAGVTMEDIQAVTAGFQELKKKAPQTADGTTTVGTGLTAATGSTGTTTDAATTDGGHS